MLFVSAPCVSLAMCFIKSDASGAFFLSHAKRAISEIAMSNFVMLNLYIKSSISCYNYVPMYSVMITAPVAPSPPARVVTELVVAPPPPEPIPVPALPTADPASVVSDSAPPP